MVFIVGGLKNGYEQYIPSLSYLCYLKLKILFLLARVELVLELALGRLKLRISLVAEVVDDDLVGELRLI